MTVAITADTLAQLRSLRIQVGALADDAVRQIAEAWLAAWERLSPAWQAAIAAAVDMAARTGRWPSAWQVARIPEVAVAADQTDQEGAALGGIVVAATAAAVAAGITATAVAEPLILASQLPVASAATAAGVYAAKVLPGPLDGIRARAQKQVTDLGLEHSATTVDTVRRAFTRGARIGDSPAGMATSLLSQVQAAFTGGAQRAITMARTEILDAYRTAAAYVHDVNSDVIGDWVWWSDLSLTTCPSCWSLHGTTHSLLTSGPLDHHQGRCVRLVRLKPWLKLGITSREPADVIPDAQTRFAALPKADQLAVMGAARLELLDSGDIEWADLAARRTTRGWRDSYTPRTVGELRRIAGRRNR